MGAPLVGLRHSEVREQGDSLVYSMERQAARALGLEDGNRPTEVEVDCEADELVLRFED